MSKIFRGVPVGIGNHILVDTVALHTKCYTVFATMTYRIEEPIFGIISPTLRLWLVFLTEMPAAFEWDVASK